MKTSILLLIILFGSVCTVATATEDTKTVQITQSFKPQVEGEVVDLWIPIPIEVKGYQSIVSLTHSGNADNVKTETVSGVQILHASWSKTQHPEFKVETVIKIKKQRGALKDDQDVSRYLQATAHVQTDGIVQETAKKIVGKIKDDDQKAKAIYNWIVEMTTRDPGTRGCGFGDVKSTLTVGNLSGKCADLNSLFVGLARAAKIPAREAFGLRVDSSIESAALGKAGDISKSQHCRAEYYSAKRKSWIPVDPADVRKVILEEKLTIADAKINKLKSKFFGYWEGNWTIFNYGRDFVIPHAQKDVQVNYFMYPLLVSKSSSPDGMDPKEVSYTIESKIL